MFSELYRARHVCSIGGPHRIHDRGWGKRTTQVLIPSDCNFASMRAAESRLTSIFIQEYVNLTKSDPLPKNWNFPKVHMLKHLFEDIKAKGATRNYNTKPNEKLHGPLKESYRLRTNFKNVAGQVLSLLLIFGSRTISFSTDTKGRSLVLCLGPDSTKNRGTRRLSTCADSESD